MTHQLAIGNWQSEIDCLDRCDEMVIIARLKKQTKEIVDLRSQI
jgi:hypothetical protein